MAGFLSNVNMLEPYAKTQAIRTNDVQRAVSEMQLNELREKEKELEQFIPESVIRTRLQSTGMGEDSMELALGDMGNMGILKERPGIGKGATQRGLNTFKESLGKMPDISRKYIEKDFSNTQIKYQKLQEIINDPKSKDVDSAKEEMRVVEIKLSKLAEGLTNVEERAKRISQMQENKRKLKEFSRDPQVTEILKKTKGTELGNALMMAMQMYANGIGDDKQLMEAFQHANNKVRDPKPTDHEQILKDRIVEEEMGKGQSRIEATKTAIRRLAQLKERPRKPESEFAGKSIVVAKDEMGATTDVLIVDKGTGKYRKATPEEVAVKGKDRVGFYKNPDGNIVYWDGVKERPATTDERKKLKTKGIIK